MVIGRVYKIITSKSDECYIGSTFGTIDERFKKHSEDYKTYLNGVEKKHTSLCDIFDKHGIDSVN
jgi:hypothetical protein